MFLLYTPRSGQPLEGALNQRPQRLCLPCLRSRLRAVAGAVVEVGRMQLPRPVHRSSSPCQVNSLAVVFCIEGSRRVFYPRRSIKWVTCENCSGLRNNSFPSSRFSFEWGGVRCSSTAAPPLDFHQNAFHR